jgi:translation initiation factor 1
MSDFNLLNSFDDFNALKTQDMATNAMSQLDAQSRKIHIRWHKEGSRSITILEGLDDDLDIVRISRAMKKHFSCSTSIHPDKQSGTDVIKLQGDQRENIKMWLVAQEILTEAEAKTRIVMHG